MYTDRWHLSFEILPDGTWQYTFAYAHPPRTTRGDCTNPIVHSHPKLKNGKFAKGVMHEGTRHYT